MNHRVKRGVEDENDPQKACREVHEVEDTESRDIDAAIQKGETYFEGSLDECERIKCKESVRRSNRR